MKKSTEQKKNPKVLVISHNCFSKSGSNGRTLSNLFLNWSKNSIAQFYISNEKPDYEICDNYLRITDIDVLKAFFGHEITEKQHINKSHVRKSNPILKNLYNKLKRKTSLNYILRNLIWNSNKWKNKLFSNWIKDFAPDLVLLQLGDYSFMHRIALDITKEYKIPIVIYNSEDYYFKDRKSYSLLYHLYRKEYKNLFKELVSISAHTIYNSEMLQKTYNFEIKHSSSVIMTSTSIQPNQNKKTNSKLKVSYLGNLGVGRHKPLIEIGNALQKIDPNITLDIYGKLPNKDVEKAFTSCKGIRLKGFVEYSEVVNIMQSSDLLVHAENFSDFYKKDLKHAFSTKIADCLASGSCLFVYAPENLAFVQYLNLHNAACIVFKKEELFSSLQSILSNRNVRDIYINNELKTAKANHNANENSQKFLEIVKSILR